MRTHLLLGLSVLSFSLAAWSSACSSDDGGDPGTPDASGDGSSNDSGGGPDVQTKDSGSTDASTKDVVTPETFNCDDAGIDPPQSLKCTGLYSTFTTTKTVAAGVKEYAPAVKLWSDGAVKTRWVFIPPGQKIDTTNMDEWVYPVGTKFWKEFVVNGKRIETRFFWKVSSSLWARTSYKWTANEDDAIRLDSGEWAGPDAGAPDAANYEIPSTTKCDQCHNGRNDKILGFEAVGLGLPGATGVTLQSLVTDQLLTQNPPATSLTIPDDGTGKSAEALGWLHANCGTACHNNNPAANCYFRGMRLRLDYEELHPSDGGTAAVANLQAYKTTVNVNAMIPSNSYKRIAPHDVANSAVSYLAGRRDPSNVNGQMPPIDSHVVDTNGVGKLNDWITALP